MALLLGTVCLWEGSIPGRVSKFMLSVGAGLCSSPPQLLSGLSYLSDDFIQLVE